MESFVLCPGSVIKARSAPKKTSDCTGKVVISDFVQVDIDLAREPPFFQSEPGGAAKEKSQSNLFAVHPTKGIV
jgi:hypothetical protein